MISRFALLCLASGSMLGSMPGTAAAQTPQPVSSAIVGQVTDTLGTPVPGATVQIVADTPNAVPTTLHTDAKGRFTVSGLSSAGTYIISARALPFEPARAEHVHLPPGDTLQVDIQLEIASTHLSAVNVRGAKSSRSDHSIRSNQINPKRTPDALDVLVHDRPRMLGDKQRCPPPPQKRDPNGKRAALTVPSDTVADYTWDNPPLVDRVYVNGIRRDIPGNISKNYSRAFTIPGAPSEGVLQVLERIPAEDILEMHYADCWDKDAPVKNALYVVLKAEKSFH